MAHLCRAPTLPARQFSGVLRLRQPVAGLAEPVKGFGRGVRGTACATQSESSVIILCGTILRGAGAVGLGPSL